MRSGTRLRRPGGGTRRAAEPHAQGVRRAGWTEVEPLSKGRRMEFHGIPLHPLVVHGAVVFTPLAALSAICFVLVERWRVQLRWPSAVLAVVAAGNCYAARVTGRNLFSKLTAS